MSKRHSADTKALVLSLRGQGLSYAKIAEQAGIPYGTVRYLCSPSLREQQVKQARKARKEKPERQRAYERTYYERNADEIRRKGREYSSAWNKSNPDRAASKAAKYRAGKLRATPPWLTGEHELQIDAIYAECSRLTKETGVRHHVDHIHPLQGEAMCGLHVPWNLQILTQFENQSKGNSLVE